MAKAGAPKKAKPKAKSKLTDKEQSERFKQTARELGVDESGADFERAVDKIIPSKRKLSGPDVRQSDGESRRSTTECPQKKKS
jgi:hypothetical protein